MTGIEDIVMNSVRHWYMDGNREPNVVLLHPSDYNQLVRYIHMNGLLSPSSDQFFFNGMELISSFSEKAGSPRVGIVA